MGEMLYLYIAVGTKSLSSVLIKEERGQQRPIYFVGKIIQGPELNYSEIERAALAVLVTARKLRPYFLPHKVIVRTSLPFKQVLGRADLSGRMVKWVVKLSEYDVDFEPRTTIKAQALADFIQETTRAEESKSWIAYVDGSVTKEGCSVGIHILAPLGDDLQFAIKYEQRLSNNETEYEAMVKALTFLSELGAEKILVKSDSRLVVQQLLGDYDVKEERMAVYHTKAKRLMSRFQECRLEQNPREQNSRADLLARMASAVEQGWKRAKANGQRSLTVFYGHTGLVPKQP